MDTPNWIAASMEWLSDALAFVWLLLMETWDAVQDADAGEQDGLGQLLRFHGHPNSCAVVLLADHGPRFPLAVGQVGHANGQRPHGEQIEPVFLAERPFLYGVPRFHQQEPHERQCIA